MSAILGLKLLRTGAPRTQTAPKPGSKTQRRRAALRGYTPAQRRGGRDAK